MNNERRLKRVKRKSQTKQQEPEPQAPKSKIVKKLNEMFLNKRAMMTEQPTILHDIVYTDPKLSAASSIMHVDKLKPVSKQSVKISELQMENHFNMITNIQNEQNAISRINSNNLGGQNQVRTASMHRAKSAAKQVQFKSMTVIRSENSIRHKDKEEPKIVSGDTFVKSPNIK